MRTIGLVSVLLQVSFLLLSIFAVALQGFLKPIFIGMTAENPQFVIPWEYLIPAVLSATLQVIFLYVILQDHKYGRISFVPEILSAVFLVAVLPFLNMVLNIVVVNSIYNGMGSDFYMHIMAVRALLSYLQFIANISTAVYFIFCGFSICLKQQRKRGLLGPN